MKRFKRYNYLDNFLQDINRKYTSFSDDEEAVNNKVVLSVLDVIIDEMRNVDSLFNNLYRRTFCGGSYYDGLNLRKSEEFDLDILLAIPMYFNPVITKCSLAGYVQVKLEDFQKFNNQEATKYPNFENLLNYEFFLDAAKVSTWTKSIIAKAFCKLGDNGSNEVTIKTTTGGKFTIKMHKSGPAHTLKLKGTINNKDIAMDVDLVSCFVFIAEKWPKKTGRSCVTSKQGYEPCSEFFVVPTTSGKMRNYWRLSLQEQERLLMAGYSNLKPAIRLLMKLRDNLDHKMIANYYIKTIFLWELETNQKLWNNSLSYIFLTMLEKYQQCLELKKIEYYWHRRYNLIVDNNRTSLLNMSDELKQIIRDVKCNPNDETILADYLLSPEERLEFFSSYQKR